MTLLDPSSPIGGRYFCLTFDGGFRNCFTNATPILLDHDAPCAFFLPTAYIGTSITADREKVQSFYGHGKSIIEFLNWDEVRKMAGAGMVIGSHTVNHSILIDLSATEVADELKLSKEIIERELEMPCRHFCAPRGRPGLDYNPVRDPGIAAGLNYRSFLSTRRGSAFRRTHPMEVERDHMVAYWGLYQLRYFLSQ